MCIIFWFEYFNDSDVVLIWEIVSMIVGDGMPDAKIVTFTHYQIRLMTS